MQCRGFVSICCLLGMALPLFAEDGNRAAVRKMAEDPVFQKIAPQQKMNVDKDRDLLMGSYLLKAEAIQELSKVDTFKQSIHRIRTTDWTINPWTRQNADLTVRQRMDDYIRSAGEFYTGKGQRPGGVVGTRLDEYTDIELGDRQLQSALLTVQMAAAWDLPLQAGQAERLDKVLRKRLELIRLNEK